MTDTLRDQIHAAIHRHVYDMPVAQGEATIDRSRSAADAVMAVVGPLKAVADEAQKIMDRVGYDPIGPSWTADADTQQHMADLIRERDQARGKLRRLVDAVTAETNPKAASGELLTSLADACDAVAAMEEAGDDHV